MSTATQATRQLSITTPLGKDAVLLRSLSGREALSELYEYEVELLSESDHFDPQEILGRNVTLLIDRDEQESRHINGIVSEFKYLGQGDQFSKFSAKVVPWLWQLTLSTDSRIFQDLTTPEILEQVFQDLGFEWFEMQLQGQYRPRKYCVQYRETDFAFVSRLMEEEGIYYYFRHENGKHTLVLADSTTAYFDLPDNQVELAPLGHTAGILDQLKTWERKVEFRTGAVTQTDYNFRRPKANLASSEQSLVNLGFNQLLEIYDYPGRYQKPGLGKDRTRVRMEAIEATQTLATGESTYRSFTPGGQFKITSHRTESEVGKQYVLLSVETRASVSGSYLTGGDESGDFEFDNEFHCIPAETVFRPTAKTPKSIVEGPQTAVVVGPKGEEIYTDEHGRVKCQFHWDRLGRRNEKSSCWIRVSQVHAGKGWGSISIPRIGEEVLVSFLEGDPDRPIIKGRVYNAEKRPPFALPAGKTRSGMKSDTHKGSGNNEISADDTAGAEQLRTNAQFNMDTTVGNSQTLAVGVDRTEDIGNNDTLTVAVDKSADIGNNQTTTVGNNETVTVGNNIVIEAGTAITLACGASTIHMNQAGVITISGQFITSAAAGANSIVAPLTEIVGSNMLTQAGLACFDLGGVCHIKGKETSVGGANLTAKASGPFVVKGAPIEIGEVGAPMAKLESVPGTSSSDANAGAGAGGAGSGGSSSGGGGEGGETGGGEVAKSKAAVNTGPTGDKDTNNDTAKNTAVEAGDLVKNQRGSEELPESVSISPEMDKRMDDLMEKSANSKVDPETGQKDEYAAAIGIDKDGKLHMGPDQNTGPNGVRGVDMNKVPPGTEPVGSFHTHPGDQSLPPSNNDYGDLRDGDEKIMIVQSNDERYMIASTRDAEYGELVDFKNGKYVKNPNADQILAERQRLESLDPKAREQATVDYAKNHKHGYYKGSSGSTGFEKRAP